MNKKPFPYKSHNINFTTRKSRLATRIVSYFRDKLKEEHPHFGAILDKYAQIGMSKRSVKTVLEERMGECSIKIRENTLDEAIKAEIVQGRTKFYIAAKTKDNPFHGNRGIRRRLPMFEEGPVRIVEFKCITCRGKHSEKTLVTDEGYVRLNSRKCKLCQGKLLIAPFRFNGQIIYKAMIDGKESFINPKEKKQLIRKETTQ